MTDTRKYLQTQKFTLSSSISLSDTSIALTSFNMPDGTAIVSGDLGTINYATIEPGTSSEEQISFTGLTGTTLTGVTRGLKFDAPYDQDTDLRKAHASGSILVLSNTSAFYDNFVNKNNDETITQTHTYTAPNYPRMDNVTNAPVDDEELTSKKYVDDVGAGGTLSKNRTVVVGTAGETLAAGDFVYLKVSDGEWYKTDANATATTDKIKLGIAQGVGTDGNTISGGVLTSGLDANQSGLTVGALQYLSDTAGEIAESAGTIERIVGQAKSATEIHFDPYFGDYVIADQVDALSGDLGTPSSDNTYVTEQGLQKGAEIYAADAEASDTYVITLDPVPAQYYTGMVIHFKANTSNTGACTINVNSLGAKSIKKQHDQDPDTGDIESGQIVTIVYDGTNFQMQSQTAMASSTVDEQTYTSNDTWTKPTGAKKVLVQAWGGGGGGGDATSDAGDDTAAGGGGGGAYKEFMFDADDLGATESVVVGAGGAAGAAGGNSTFDSLTAYGGGAGIDAGNAEETGGGGGGGSTAVGSNSTNANGGAGGALVGSAESTDNGAFGGAGGGALSTAGGSSVKGGAGGGGGEKSATGSGYAGGASVYGGGGGGGGNNNGSAAGGTSTFGGNGGAGGTGDSNGTAGTAPGGGGGGAARLNTGTSTGGAGADGKVIVTTFS